MPGILNRFLPSNFGAQRCPDCDEPLKAEDINIKEGVALCPICSKLSRLSSLNTSSRSIAEFLDKPPAGCLLTSSGHGAVGFLKWKRRFDPRDVRAIEFGHRWQSESGKNQVLEIQSTRTVKFGSLLNEEQMQWLRAVLREILLQQTIHNRQKSSLPVLPWLSRAHQHRNPTH